MVKSKFHQLFSYKELMNKQFCILSQNCLRNISAENNQ